jgi:hypothetical protein
MQPLEVHITLKVITDEKLKLSISKIEPIKFRIKDISIPMKVRELEEPVRLFVSESDTVKLTIREGGGKYPTYTGETRITPKVREETELETARKLVMDNIIVEEIPYYETSNIKGITFVIGG